MEARFNLTRSIIEDVGRILANGLGKPTEPVSDIIAEESATDVVDIDEKLMGDQKKIDKNKNGKIDSEDFEKLRKEESEPIAELANSTLKSYIKKSRKSSEKAETKLDREEDKAMSTDGIKYPEKQRRHQDAANAAADVYIKRQKGLKTAKAKAGVKDHRPSWMGEEADTIDELTKSTLGSYIKKSSRSAVSHAATAQYSDDTDADSTGDNKKVMKRLSGISRASTKLTKEEVSDIDEGRGKKGQARHQKMDDEWEDDAAKKGKKKFAPVKSTKKAAWDESYEYVIVSEEFGIGEIMEVSEDFATIVFEGRIEDISLDDIFVEEVEDLEELSKDTMKSYQTKASAQLAGSVKRGKPSSSTLAMRAKRGSGMENAKAKLAAIYKKEHAAHRSEMTKLNNHLDDHFMKEHGKILAKHGYDKHHSHEDGTTYTKKHTNGHVSMIHVKHNENNSFGSSKHVARALNTKGSSWSSHNAHHGAYDKKDHAEHLTNMLPKFEKYVMDAKEHTDDAHRW